MNTLTTPPLTVMGIATRHAVLGDGDTPILMLHGWGANLELMLPLAERLARLPHYRVYVLDLPGFGETAPPPDVWTVYDYARFVVAYLDAQQLARVHLIGHSFGGRLSLILGADYADRVEKIVLANSAGVRPRVPLLTKVRQHSYKAARTGLQRVGLGALATQLQGWYNRRYGSADFQSASGVMRGTFVQVVNEDLLPVAARIQRSTLLIWGDRDEDTPLWQAKQLEQTIRDAGLVVFEGAGHYSYLERAADAAHVIDYFFQH